MDGKSPGSICILNIFNGLVEGISHFSQPSRVALIYAVKPSDDILIYDPQGLLKGHELTLKKIYLDTPAWRNEISRALTKQPRGEFLPGNQLNIAGLIHFGGSSHSLFYQMWFTEHHPDMCSIYPTERWLEHAGRLMAQDFSSGIMNFNTSGQVLQNYSIHAITDHIVKVRSQLIDHPTELHIHSILDTILKISKTREEGAWSRGRIIFMDPENIEEIDFITKIQEHERPAISNAKHIRKLLLAVEHSDRELVSDGKTIIGISNSDIPDFAITANFHGDHGFLELQGTKICSFNDGNFYSSTKQTKLVELEELLLESDLAKDILADLFRTIAFIVHTAETKRYGSTLIIDLNDEPVKMAGHIIEPCINLLNPQNLDLACSLAKIDGALHIMASGVSLRGFACLLDGKSIRGENMARGARYNSALRFTAEHGNIIAVVISSDRPVSVINRGVEINALDQWDDRLTGQSLKAKPLKKRVNEVYRGKYDETAPTRK